MRKRGAEKSNSFVKVTKDMLKSLYESRGSDSKACAFSGHIVLPWGDTFCAFCGAQDVLGGGIDIEREPRCALDLPEVPPNYCTPLA